MLFLATKVGKYTGIFNKLKRYWPFDILRILYSCIVKPELNYAILVWGVACTRINKLQKRIESTITCSRYNTHTSPLFKSLLLLTLGDMLKVNVFKFYYKYLHNELQHYFYSLNIRTQGDAHLYDTRFSGQLQRERTRTQDADKRYLPTLIIDMSAELLANLSLQDFTKIPKNFRLNNTQWYTPSLAAIYVRALSTHFSVIHCLKWYSSTLMGGYVHRCLHVLILHACMCMYAYILMGDVCMHSN